MLKLFTVMLFVRLASAQEISCLKADPGPTGMESNRGVTPFLKEVKALRLTGIDSPDKLAIEFFPPENSKLDWFEFHILRGKAEVFRIKGTAKCGSGEGDVYALDSVAAQSASKHFSDGNKVLILGQAGGKLVQVRLLRIKPSI